MKRCLDEETIQRLMDGELPAPSRRAVEAHLEGCPSCAASAREAGREEAFVSSFFAPRLLVAVPTARLLSRIRYALLFEGSAARCE